MKPDLDEMRVNPNPRLVALLDYAIDEVIPRLPKSQYQDWKDWAARWRSGERSPADCVGVSHRCSALGDDDGIAQCLRQLAWGGKEACYSTQSSGWLVVRYIADAMIAFGIAFPKDGLGKFLGAPTIDGEIVSSTRMQLDRH